MEPLEEQRETWGTRGGFVLAAVGSAVGLGNLWGFPYKVYSHGGGAFLIPYIIAVFCVGIPVLALEFSLGHFTQRAAPDAFARTNKKLEFVGWWGIFLGFVIVTFYPAILAYCFSFIYYSVESIITGNPLPWAGEGIEGVENAQNFFYNTYLQLDQIKNLELGTIRYNILIPLVIAWLSMYLCIFKGVKLVGKIVWITVTLPWITLFVLTIRGLTLPGSMNGLVYYLDPVWSELAKPSTWQYAFGQAFFSLSLAFGVMVTYASFLHKKSDINNNAAIIGLADFSTSFIAGLAVFSTLGGMAYITAQSGNPISVEKVVAGGPGLAFVAFPYALAQLPAAAWWSLLFFSTLVLLGIDSAFSITESILASLVDKTGWKRCFVLPLISFIGLGFGIVFVTQGGLNWLGIVADFIFGTWGIAFLGLLECIVLGWLYRVDNLRIHANERSDWKLGIWWNYLIRVVIPVILGTLFIWGAYNDFSKQEGFLFDSSGSIILQNWIGMIIVILVPIISILMSAVQNPQRSDSYYPNQEIINPLFYSGKVGGAIAICYSIVSSGMIVVIFLMDTSFNFQLCMLAISFVLSVISLFIANYILDKYKRRYSQPSWLARWAGIIATMNISASLAIILIYITQNITIETVPKDSDKLSSISYIILAAVMLMMIGGLGWCFYRAITASAKEAPLQKPAG